jgi:hypothetical protein
MMMLQVMKILTKMLTKMLTKILTKKPIVALHTLVEKEVMVVKEKVRGKAAMVVKVEKVVKEVAMKINPLLMKTLDMLEARVALVANQVTQVVKVELAIAVLEEKVEQPQPQHQRRVFLQSLIQTLWVK